jgi:thioredoxin reductase (NADPH)
VVELIGNEWLQAVTIESGGGQRVIRQVCGVFVMIGADPCTDWLRGAVQLDDRRFVLTQQNAAGAPAKGPFETNIPGVFAVGDVRSGSVKRVASAAVGEGAQVVQLSTAFSPVRTIR